MSDEESNGWDVTKILESVTIEKLIADEDDGNISDEIDTSVDPEERRITKYDLMSEMLDSIKLGSFIPKSKDADSDDAAQTNEATLKDDKGLISALFPLSLSAWNETSRAEEFITRRDCTALIYGIVGRMHAQHAEALDVIRREHEETLVASKHETLAMVEKLRQVESDLTMLKQQCADQSKPIPKCTI